MLTELADVVRSAGLTVAEVPGWEARGHGPQASVDAIVIHHTAGAAGGESPSLDVVRTGRSDLAGPLAHFVVGRTGTWHVVAAGLCWHAGRTLETWQANGHSIGIECEGTGHDSWPGEQYAAIVRGTRALAQHYKVPFDRVLGHKEVCAPLGRKSDPNFPMGAFRVGLGAAVRPPADKRFPTLKKGSKGPYVEKIQRFLGVVGPGEPGYGLYGQKTEQVVRKYQAMRGIVADGVCGPKTWRETGLRP
jgi:N-acetyl-anhydromuramyl-L-alanine amidase AmpD